MESLREMCILGREVLLSKLLGAGSNGRVYLATPVTPSGLSNAFPYPSRFVVKIMRKGVWPVEHVEKAMKEIDAVRRLRHPFIVSYVGAWMEAGGGEHSGSVCLATTYCDGGDLDILIRDYSRRSEWVPNDLVMLVMMQVMSALNYSHMHHVIHRDIKPANLFLMRGEAVGGVEKVLVGDYGISRPIDPTVELAKTRVGTPCYCSPEIASGEAYTTKTDIFSAGVTFFELMSKHRPFWGKGFTERQAFSAILHTDPLPLLRRVAEGRYDNCLVHAVAACLSKKEKSRPTAFELLTSFAARLTKYVRAKRIPVCSEPERTSPRRGSAGESSPPRHLSPVSPVSPVRRSPSRLNVASPPRKSTPCRGDHPSAAPSVASPAGEGAPPSPGQKEAPTHGGFAAEQLLHVMERSAGDRVECDRLRRLLGGDAEAFMLVQVLLHTRRNNRNALENGIFKLLLSLKPDIAVEPVMSWMAARKPVA